MASFFKSLLTYVLVASTSALTIPKDALMKRSTNGYANVAYFANWDIYGRNYQPTDIPASQITHLIYCFANLQSDGTVVLSDSYADLQKHYPTDSWNDVGNNVYGNVKQLYLLKKANRGMKVLLSIGGWTYSPSFAAPMSTDAGREQFASTAVQFVQDLGFDGIDIDWEYPANPDQASAFVSLLQTLRTKLDAYTSQYGGNRMLITTAMPAGPTNYQQLDLAGMNQYVDLFNLMAYDYAGSFSNVTGHMANLYPSSSNPNSTPFATDPAVSYYLSHGVPANKFTLGMPIYGRDFDGTSGAGEPYSGAGTGSWEAGVWDYKVLPQAGATVYYDDEVGASYSHDSSKQIFMSYDDVESVQKKVSYLTGKGLGGAMFWELSGDSTGTSSSLVTNVLNQLQSSGGVDTTQNTLSYPGSQYDNMKAGMPS